MPEMPKIEHYIYRAYTWTPVILLLISLITWVLGKWNKKKGKDWKRYSKVSSLSLIIVVIIFFIFPVLPLIIGFGPGMMDSLDARPTSYFPSMNILYSCKI